MMGRSSGVVPERRRGDAITVAGRGKTRHSKMHPLSARRGPALGQEQQQRESTGAHARIHMPGKVSRPAAACRGRLAGGGDGAGRRRGHGAGGAGRRAPGDPSADLRSGPSAQPGAGRGATAGLPRPAGRRAPGATAPAGSPAASNALVQRAGAAARAARRAAPGIHPALPAPRRLSGPARAIAARRCSRAGPGGPVGRAGRGPARWAPAARSVPCTRCVR